MNGFPKFMVWFICMIYTAIALLALVVGSLFIVISALYYGFPGLQEQFTSELAQAACWASGTVVLLLVSAPITVLWFEEHF